MQSLDPELALHGSKHLCTQTNIKYLRSIQGQFPFWNMTWPCLLLPM